MFLSKGLVIGSVLGVVILGMACGGGGELQCLRMSDCEAPFQCVEGTCRSEETLGDNNARTVDAASDAAASDQ